MKKRLFLADDFHLLLKCSLYEVMQTRIPSVLAEVGYLHIIVLWYRNQMNATIMPNYVNIALEYIRLIFLHLQNSRYNEVERSFWKFFRGNRLKKDIKVNFFA